MASSEARRPRGFLQSADPPMWLRGPARIEGEWLVLDRASAESYLPLTTPKQVMLFALAACKTRRQMVDFASRFGLLTHGPSAPELREAVAEFETAAKELDVWLRLTNALRGAMKGDKRQAELLRLMMNHFSNIFQAPPASDEELQMQMSKLIAWSVSHQLRDTTMRIDAACDYDVPNNQPGVFMFNAHPPNLLGWIYHELAQVLVMRSSPMAMCADPECGRMFVPEDARQRFCQPSCANRARFRRWKTSKVNGAKTTEASSKKRSRHGKATRKR